ncbi:peroxiredoxin family protein [Sphingobacterium deserti]|uniref:Alkyl hydroperoxide reductase/thiol specific antioxidant/Mal allergen n=1 Tax=Sphingobacterium deserti TaxID=1229276 RepID=A0A0B8T5E0_9SPHI|nr:protein disulfide isomerase family protein [Sphingobacterium deserti]KGE15723.1 alkyl hydroperoxide reductase/thiol specific antioxidant/Mal allergen [Sphingobacterium deserti]
MTKIRLLLALVLFASYCVAQKQPAQLPSLTKLRNLYNPDATFQKMLPSKGKIVLVFYDPGCGHCQELGENISKNIAKFQQSSIFFITMNDKEYVDGYINMFAKGLKTRKNVSFWKEESVEFIEKFNPVNYPATYIYDAATKKLVKSFQGESKTAEIARFVQ